MPEPVPGIAFFDVDETLISFKSMFDFYDFFLAAQGYSAAEQESLRGQARALLRPGLPREEGNRLFYQRFASHKAAAVAETGREWFQWRLDRGGLFHREVLAALRELQAAGLMAVLVSGSFHACLDPLVQYCGAAFALGTELEVRDGVYTGEVIRTMIGEAKAEAAQALMREHAVHAADCHAYGDHTSDIGLLSLVGHPVAVGDNADLGQHAEQRGWPRLAATPT